jgi:hypothetical protein
MHLSPFTERNFASDIRIPLRTFFFNPVDLLLVSDEDELLTELVNQHRHRICDYE